MSDTPISRRNAITGALAAAGLAATGSHVLGRSSSRTFWRGSSLVYAVALSPDGNTVFAGDSNGDFILIDLRSGKEFGPHPTNALRVHSAAFSPDGRTVVSGTHVHLRLWDAVSAKHVRNIWDPEMVLHGVENSETHTQWAHRDAVYAVAFSPDGRTLLSAGGDDMVKLWDVQSGKRLKVFEGHTLPVEAVAFTPNGQMALSGSRDDTLRLWDVATGAEARKMAGNSARVLSVAISPDGRTALSGGYDGSLRWWELESGKQLRPIAAHTGPVNAVKFTPDGRRIVTCGGGSLTSGRDSTVRVWDAETGKLAQTLSGHKGGVYSLAITPDGRRAISGAYDGVRVWELSQK